jgi:hypothetical protein
VTFVVARKFGERIIILSDTMITRPHDLKHDIIPGQLKAIVLSLNISVAFSGHFVTALDRVRACKRQIEQGGGLSEVLDILSNADSRECDFLVASHVNDPELFKISGGVVSESQDCHWIGNSDLIGIMEKQQDCINQAYQNVLRMDSDMPDMRSEEDNFIGTFTQLFLSEPQVADGVGGFAVILLASPFGHCYLHHSGIQLIGPFNGNGTPHPEGPALGGSRYSYSILDSGYRGVGIVGSFMEDTHIGYIYDPLGSDAAVTMSNVTMRAVIDELNIRGSSSGGKIESEC